MNPLFSVNIFKHFCAHLLKKDSPTHTALLSHIQTKMSNTRVLKNTYFDKKNKQADKYISLLKSISLFMVIEFIYL